MQEWRRNGVLDDLVDAAALHDHWSAETPDAHCLTLLQGAWPAAGVHDKPVSAASSVAPAPSR